MASSQRGPWSHHRPDGLATILFIVALIGVVSACGPRATRTSSTPSTPVQPIRTVYFMGQSGSVDALQSENGRLRWHKQLDKERSITVPSLLVFGDVVYVGRASEICSPLCKTIGSIDALKVSDGTVLWHSNVGEYSAVKVLKVVNNVVYVAVDTSDGYAPSGYPDGYVYALRASDGSQLWRYTVGGGCCRGLVVTDTAIYLGGLDHVDAIKTSDRTLLWHHQIDRPSVLAGIAVVDGVVYVGTALVDYRGPAKGSLDALRTSDGTGVWHSQTNFASRVLTVADGIVYVGEFLGSTLDALRASDGSLLWQYQSDLSPWRATVMDGVVYLTCTNVGYKDTGSTVNALRVSDGSHLWRYHSDPGFLQVAVADGMVYVGTPHGIVALDANSGNKRWFHAADNDYVFALAVGP